jgi:hypothetical protein
MRKLIAFVAVVSCLLAVDAASAAAPRIVIFSGAPLEHQIVVSDWRAIFAVTQATASAPAVPRRRLAARPSLRVSMFWGPGWNDYVRQGRDPNALRPAQADQVGRFFPAHHGRGALLDLPWAGRWPRRVPPAALSVLKRFGIPVAA